GRALDLAGSTAEALVTASRGADHFVESKSRRCAPFSESYADHVVQKARKRAGLPSHVTLAACRHGGMTQLGSAKADVVEGCCATAPSVRCDEYRRLASAESRHRTIVSQAVAALEERQGAQRPTPVPEIKGKHFQLVPPAPWWHPVGE